MLISFFFIFLFLFLFFVWTERASQSFLYPRKKLSKSVNLQVKSKQLINIIDNFVNMFLNIWELFKQSLYNFFNGKYSKNWIYNLNKVRGTPNNLALTR